MRSSACNGTCSPRRLQALARRIVQLLRRLDRAARLEAELFLHGLDRLRDGARRLVRAAFERVYADLGGEDAEALSKAWTRARHGGEARASSPSMRRFSGRPGARPFGVSRYEAAAADRAGRVPQPEARAKAEGGGGERTKRERSQSGRTDALRPLGAPARPAGRVGRHPGDHEKGSPIPRNPERKNAVPLSIPGGPRLSSEVCISLRRRALALCSFRSTAGARSARVDARPYAPARLTCGPGGRRGRRRAAGRGN